MGNKILGGFFKSARFLLLISYHSSIKNSGVWRGLEFSRSRKQWLMAKQFWGVEARYFLERIRGGGGGNILFKVLPFGFESVNIGF